MATFEYAPAPESRAVVDIASSYGLFIDGEFVDGTGTSMKSINPATEEVLAEVAVASEADVDRAVKAARRAYTRVWSRTYFWNTWTRSSRTPITPGNGLASSPRCTPR